MFSRRTFSSLFVSLVVRKVPVIKNLEFIWTSLEGNYSAANTILLDDTAHKARFQPFNHLHVPEYTKEMRAKDLVTQVSSSSSVANPNADHSLLAVVGILSHLRMQDNVEQWFSTNGICAAPEATGTVSGVESVSTDDASAEEQEQTLWYSKPDTLAYWVRQGQQSLAAAGIVERYF